MTSPKKGSKLSELAKIQRTGDRIILPLVQEYLLSQWGHGDRDPTVVHVSEMAKKDWCERATYFRIKTAVWPEEKYSFNMQSIFDEGHQIHDKWQQWLAATGKLWGDWECQFCLRKALRTLMPDTGGSCGSRLGHHWAYKEVSLRHGIITGHEDGAVEDRLVEFKSVGIGTLRKESPALLAKHYVQKMDGKKIYDLEAVWACLKQPLMSHVRQANLYLYLAGMMGRQDWGEAMRGMEQYKRFTKASIVYEYKPNQQSREFVIPFSADIVEPLIERVGYIEVALAQDHPPRCPYGGCAQCHDYEDQADKLAHARGVRTPSGRLLSHTSARDRDDESARIVRSLRRSVQRDGV